MILEEIVRSKLQELSTPGPPGERFEGSAASFRQGICKPGISIIAEIKYQSPSHGPFTCQKPPAEIGLGYARAGAAAISILTDRRFFAGSLDHLRQVAVRLQEENQKPLLRKDFILQVSQVREAARAGASAVLLIVACLDDGKLRHLLETCQQEGLDALVEVHARREADRALACGASIIGVNNRNLHTFEVDVETSFRLGRHLEQEREIILVAESGLSDPSPIRELHDAGFEAFLIGSQFMNSEDPGGKLKELLTQLS